MTLVVGLTCGEGIVLASDSQVSSGNTRSSGQKIWAVQEGPFIFGLAGVESTLQLLLEALLPMRFADDKLATARTTLGQVARSVLDPEYERVRRLRGDFDLSSMPIGGVVLGTFAEGHPRLLVSDQYATVSEQREFVAIGTGGIFGQHAATVFRAIRSKTLTLHQTKMLALRVVQDAIQIAGPSVALNSPIQMATLARRDDLILARHLDDDDPATLDAVQNWTAAEAERFLDHQPLEGE